MSVTPKTAQPKQSRGGPSYDPRVDPARLAAQEAMRKFVAESHKNSPRAAEKLK